MSLGLVACAPSTPACPSGAAPDPADEARLRSRLAELAPELATVAATVCFATDLEEGLAAGVVVLAPRGDRDARAAHLGHLLLHVLTPIDLPAGPACLDHLEAAVEAERVALGREDSWRAAWGLPALGPEAVDDRRRMYAARCAR